MNDRLNPETIRRSLRTGLSGVQAGRDFAKGVWQQEEQHPLSRKLVFSLAVLLSVLFAAAAAAGILLWKNRAEQMVHLEQQSGRFCEWNTSDKIALINGMLDLKLFEMDESISLLNSPSVSDAEKSRIADEIVLSFLDNNAYIASYETSYNHTAESISAELLTFAVLGPSESWSAEQRAWWQQLLHPAISSANDLVLTPAENGDISEQQAITIASQALQRILHVPEDQIQSAQKTADLYITDERPGYRRWLVTFGLFAPGSHQDVAHCWEVFVDSSGHLIADADYGTVLLEEKAADLSTNQPNVCYPPILEIYRSFAEYEGSWLVREWSLESKAEYSAAVRSKVLDALANERLHELINPYAGHSIPHGEVTASSRYAYGLPAAEHLSADDARSLARRWLWLEYGLEVSLCKEQYRYYEFFDCTVPAKPVWKFVFFPESFEGLDSVPVYKIILNASSGEKISAARYEWKELFDQEPYQEVWY